MIDVLFIHPGNHKVTYQDLSNEYTAIAPPSWTALLANYVRKNGYSVAIHDTNLNGFDASRDIGKYKPKLVVIMVYGHHPSASTQTMNSASIIANKIKEYNKDIPIAMGGTHPSALPAQTLFQEKIDYVIIGEGAYQITLIAGYITGKNKIEDLRGVYYRKKDHAVKAFNCSLIHNLDKDLDNYAFDLLPDLSLYRCHDHHAFGYDTRSPYIAMNTSLGCPFNCSFCCINSVFGKPGVRYWSIETVMSWIDLLVNKYHIQHIRLDDELFILDNKRVNKFCNYLIERKYNLNIWVYARVDTIDERLLPKMKKAGINWICLGIESANKDVRIGVNKKISKNIVDVVSNIKSNGINIIGNYMFGLPLDNIETMQETLDLATKLNCEYANFYCTMAYPGSSLYDFYRGSNFLPRTWNGFSQHSYETKPLPTKFLSSADVLKFRDNAFNAYFSNDNYLNMIQNKFGEKTKEHIKNMLKIKIKRRLIDDSNKRTTEKVTST